MRNLPGQHRARGKAEAIFLVFCGVVAVVALALMVRHADDYDPLVELVRAEWSAVNEEFERTLEAFREVFGTPAPGEEDEAPALVVAARDGNGPLLMRLLAGGADVNVSDDEGRTPLMHAAEQGRVVIARVLLEAGADPELRDDEGRTAADHARRAGHDTLSELLEAP